MPYLPFLVAHVQLWPSLQQPASYSCNTPAIVSAAPCSPGFLLLCFFWSSTEAESQGFFREGVFGELFCIFFNSLGDLLIFTLGYAELLQSHKLIKKSIQCIKMSTSPRWKWERTLNSLRHNGVVQRRGHLLASATGGRRCWWDAPHSGPHTDRWKQPLWKSLEDPGQKGYSCPQRQPLKIHSSTGFSSFLFNDSQSFSFIPWDNFPK